MGGYMCYLWLLHVLSMALTWAIFGTYMGYLWQMRGAIANVELQG